MYFFQYDIAKHGRGISPIKIFYMSLLFWDVIIGCGSMLNIRWIQRGQIMTGEYCVAQGKIPVPSPLSQQKHCVADIEISM
jgi:hypothetical protein